MRTRAVSNEQRRSGVFLHLGLDDFRVRQVDRAGDVALGEQGGTTDVQQNKPGRAAAQRGVGMPTVGLVFELIFKMRNGFVRLGGRDLRNGIWHNPSSMCPATEGHCRRLREGTQLAEVPFSDQIMPKPAAARKPINTLVVA